MDTYSTLLINEEQRINRDSLYTSTEIGTFCQQTPQDLFPYLGERRPDISQFDLTLPRSVKRIPRSLGSISNPIDRVRPNITILHLQRTLVQRLKKSTLCFKRSPIRSITRTQILSDYRPHEQPLDHELLPKPWRHQTTTTTSAQTTSQPPSFLFATSTTAAAPTGATSADVLQSLQRA